jgi:hypothetical protein
MLPGQHPHTLTFGFDSHAVTAGSGIPDHLLTAENFQSYQNQAICVVDAKTISMASPGLSDIKSHDAG